MRGLYFNVRKMNTSMSNNPLSKILFIVLGLLISLLLIFRNKSYPVLISPGQVRDCRTWLPTNYTLPNQQKDNLDLKNDSENHQHRLKGWEHDWKAQVPNVPKSGVGSTLEASKNFREALDKIVDNLKRELKKETITILDAPCGDMTWMPSFLRSRSDVIYTGYDLIPQNIEENRKKFSNESWSFSEYDIVKSSINQQFDLIINRHVAIHLGLMDAMKMYANFLQSGSSYLLTTSTPSLPYNTELSPSKDHGRQFHEVNLNLFPFQFPAPVCHNPDATTTQFMEMWKLGDLIQFQKEAAKMISR